MTHPSVARISGESLRPLASTCSMRPMEAVLLGLIAAGWTTSMPGYQRRAGDISARGHCSVPSEWLCGRDFGPSSIPVRVALTHSTAGLAYGHRRTRLRKHDDRTRLRLDRYRNGERSQRGYGGREPVTELETAMYRIVQEALTNAIRRGGVQSEHRHPRRRGHRADNRPRRRLGLRHHSEGHRVRSDGYARAHRVAGGSARGRVRARPREDHRGDLPNTPPEQRAGRLNRAALSGTRETRPQRLARSRRRHPRPTPGPSRWNLVGGSVLGETAPSASTTRGSVAEVVPTVVSHDTTRGVHGYARRTVKTHSPDH